MKKYFFYFLSMAIMVFMIGGCSNLNNSKMLKGPASKNKTSNAAENGIKYPSVNSYGNSSQNSQKLITEREQIKQGIKSLKKEIHFNFNSSNLEPIDEYGINENPVDILNNIASFMLKHPSVKIRIEGNCDERGTEEYNLALGEKRALAAKSYLEAKGVDAKRIDTVSYGESQPLDPAHTEQAWAKNRRDHFVFFK